MLHTHTPIKVVQRAVTAVQLCFSGVRAEDVQIDPEAFLDSSGEHENRRFSKSLVLLLVFEVAPASPLLGACLQAEHSRPPHLRRL